MWGVEISISHGRHIVSAICWISAHIGLLLILTSSVEFQSALTRIFLGSLHLPRHHSGVGRQIMGVAFCSVSAWLWLISCSSQWIVRVNPMPPPKGKGESLSKLTIHYHRLPVLLVGYSCLHVLQIRIPSKLTFITPTEARKVTAHHSLSYFSGPPERFCF